MIIVNVYCASKTIDVEVFVPFICRQIVVRFCVIYHAGGFGVVDAVSYIVSQLSITKNWQTIRANSSSSVTSYQKCSIAGAKQKTFDLPSTQLELPSNLECYFLRLGTRLCVIIQATPTAQITPSSGSLLAEYHMKYENRLTLPQPVHPTAMLRNVS